MNSKFPPGSPQAYEEELRRLPPNTKLDKNHLSPRTEQLFKSIPKEKAYRNAGSAFYWIAGLSLVNSLVQMFGGSFYFVAGLGMTQLVDGVAAAFAQDFPEISKIAIGKSKPNQQ